jgi:hypothetical protein
VKVVFSTYSPEDWARLEKITVPRHHREDTVKNHSRKNSSNSNYNNNNMELHSVSKVDIVSRRQEDREEPGSWRQVLSSCGNRASPTQKNREDGGNKGPAMEKHLGSGNNKAYSVRSSPRYITSVHVAHITVSTSPHIRNIYFYNIF